MDFFGFDVLYVGVCYFEEYSLMFVVILFGIFNSFVVWIVGKNGVYLNFVWDVWNVF